MRGGGPLSFDLSQLQGLISFPSYHTVLAVLLTYAHRRSALLPPIALVNGVMLFSIPSYGGHYLIDMIAGAAVALLGDRRDRGGASAARRSLGRRPV